jgi:hypothetical protein
MAELGVPAGGPPVEIVLSQHLNARADHALKAREATGIMACSQGHHRQALPAGFDLIHSKRNLTDASPGEDGGECSHGSPVFGVKELPGPLDEHPGDRDRCKRPEIAAAGV